MNKKEIAKVRAIEDIKRNPGTIGKALATRLDTPYATVMAGVDRLVAEGEVVRMRFGKAVRLYPKGYDRTTHADEETARKDARILEDMRKKKEQKKEEEKGQGKEQKKEEEKGQEKDVRTTVPPEAPAPPQDDPALLLRQADALRAVPKGTTVDALIDAAIAGIAEKVSGQLKPCPHCGRTPSLCKDVNGSIVIVCGCDLYIKHRSKPKDIGALIDAYNRRGA